MNLTPDALTQFAVCISRGEYITIEFGDTLETEVWCNGCLEHSAIRYALKGMSERGTYDLGELTWCTIHDRKDR